MSEFIMAIPNLLFGPGSMNEVGGKFNEFGCKRVLIIVDKMGAKVGFADRMTKILKDSGIGFVLFDGAESDPPARVVNQAADLARKEKIDGIVAIGGGSVIDTGKSVNMLVNSPGHIEDYLAGFYVQKEGMTKQIGRAHV
jgi:alcohol dehydrogenase class IV